MAKWPKSSGALRTGGPGGEREHVRENCIKDKAAKAFFSQLGQWGTSYLQHMSRMSLANLFIYVPLHHTHTHSRFLHFVELSSRTSQKGECAFRCYTTLFATASLAFNCFALLGKGQELSGRKRPSDQTWDACREDMVSVHKLMFLSRWSSFLLLWEMMKFAFCRSSLLSQWIQWDLCPPDAKACALLHRIRPA